MVGHIWGAVLFLIVFISLMFYIMIYFPYKHTIFYYNHDPFKKSMFSLMFLFFHGVNFFKVFADHEKDGTPFSWSSYFTIFMFVLLSLQSISVFLSEYYYQKNFRLNLAKLQEMYPDENLSDLEKRVEEMLKNKHADVPQNDDVSMKDA